MAKRPKSTREQKRAQLARARRAQKHKQREEQLVGSGTFDPSKVKFLTPQEIADKEHSQIISQIIEAGINTAEMNLWTPEIGDRDPREVAREARLRRGL